MSFLLSPPTAPRQDVPGDDGLDNLLRSFYQAQLPDPWPSFEAPPDQRVLPLVTPRRGSQPLLRSRLALAASVALLVAGPWLLSGSLERGHTNGSAPSDLSGSHLVAPSASSENGAPPPPEKHGQPLDGPSTEPPMKPILSEDWHH